MEIQYPVAPSNKSCRCFPPSLLWRSGTPRIFLVLWSVLALNPQSGAAQESPVGEYELKAAILYNLTKFGEWPASAYRDSQTATVLCILGRDPFGNVLKEAIPREAAGVRPLLIRYLQRQEALGVCHLLYVSSSERKTMPQLFSALKGSGVLTVGETSRFAAQGGMIQFTLEDKQVRFDINLGAATREGVRISSKLLMLARIADEQSHNSGQ